MGDNFAHRTCTEKLMNIYPVKYKFHSFSPNNRAYRNFRPGYPNRKSKGHVHVETKKPSALEVVEVASAEYIYSNVEDEVKTKISQCLT